MMKKAEILRNRRYEAIFNENNGFFDKARMKGDFLAYFKELADRRNIKWLTGKNFSGQDAYDWGLAARVFGTPAECLEGALKTAETIAGYSRIAVKAAKEVVNKSQDLGLREGVEYERRVFHGLFGSEDQKIGMKAFAEKKKAEWANK